MGHYQKLYKKIRNNKRSVRFEDLNTLMTKVGGFECRQGDGDHYVFSHPDLSYHISVDCRGKREPLLIVYVLKSLKAFDEVNASFTEED
ncbi:hypothetical protein [Anaerospora sp.]|uniref:hypothetical protein n=1 Tax=Anaerospora sp. TaxID=1960278 RepID=UPI00289A37F0|nr:hypothetical protein [Anaerospora sp.]